MKRLKTIALIAAVFLFGVVTFVLFGPHSHDDVTRANFAQIKKGMSEAEVVSLLGPPSEKTHFLERGTFVQHHIWQGERARIKVSYDLFGHVTTGYYAPSQSIVNRIRAWFGQ